MGTRFTMQRKFELTNSIIRQCAEKEIDILYDNLISMVMCEIYCERRKAVELIKAIILKFPYKEGKVENKKGYVFQYAK